SVRWPTQRGRHESLVCFVKLRQRSNDFWDSYDAQLLRIDDRLNAGPAHLSPAGSEKLEPWSGTKLAQGKCQRGTVLIARGLACDQHYPDWVQLLLLSGLFWDLVSFFLSLADLSD